MSMKTRFAPSPTGYMHLGNARTALFNALLAGAGEGQFVLRIEDTDQDRSRAEFQHALEEDLYWLNLQWHEGPVVDGAHAPYRQSERGAIYQDYYQQLEEAGLAYPCFCSPQELKLSRQAQQASGKAPRYSGKCRNLSEAEIQARLEQGLKPSLRFRVPRGERVVFDDLVRGRQTFNTDDIGDFIIRRGDGAPAFFFSNAIDDALMDISHVMRGEDHLTNTPRQILLLEALELPIPAYGHITLIVGHDGSPLSKRHGSRSVRELREKGYLSQALLNYLARLGHTYEQDGLMSKDELATAFSMERLGRAPARYDGHQLLHWQHQVIATAVAEELWSWMGEDVHHLVPEERMTEFVETIRPNISFPEDALRWARIFFLDPLNLDDDSREVVAEAGREFFKQALAVLEQQPENFKDFADEIKQRTGAKGKQLFMPLRTALTGEQGGPEMARIFTLLSAAQLKQRIKSCID